VNDRLNKPAQAFSPQSEKDLKEDAALVSNITRTINDRSESYTENIENAYGTLATGFNAVVGLPLSIGLAHLFSKTKIGKEGGWMLQLASGVASLFLLNTPLLFIGNALERDGARVARWKTRQDIKNNPNSMLAVPDEDKASVQGIKDKNFKPKGIWDSFKQAFTLPFEFMKDHKAYQNWERTEGIEEKKRRKALDQIQLSPEQAEDAKRLQARTHEAFSLTDEYSQESEMMEASTDTLKQIAPITTFLAEPQAEQEEALEGFQKKLDKLLEEKPFLKPFKQYGEDLVKDALKLTEEMGTTHSEKASQWTKWIQEGYKYKTLRNTGVGVVGTLAIGGLAVLLGPVLLVNSIFTRWQKDSMRVGLMQADDSMKHPNFFKLDGEEKQNPQKPAVA